ncbi:MAG TPA: hypothetical protein VFB72_16855 [Verrucomicrobiae bacterium]|nr:hypothetical protein [Verrucomicrobiae bacterium]
MKINNLVLAGALSLGLASIANAQNRVYLTGSTAFRPALYNALAACFDASPAVQIAAYKCSTVGTIDPHTAGQMEFKGNIGGAAYIIKCAWSGSEAGISDVAKNSTETFIDDIGVNGVQAINSTSAASATDSHAVDLAMADTSQAVSKTQTPALTGIEVGIIPFIWIKNAQGHPYHAGTYPDYDRIVNVTHPQLRVALTGGTLAALITGNASDTNHYVYVSGRDNNSGTRVNTFCDTGYGVFKLPQQIIITGSDGAPTIQNGATTTSGQSSGGTLATTMTYSGSATAADPINGGTGWYAIAYVGMYDADVALASGGDAVALTLNGVAESPAAVEQGQYSFWGNEHIYQNVNGLSSAANTVYNSLTTGGKISGAVDGTHEISLSAMQATKTTDLSDPTHN